MKKFIQIVVMVLIMGSGMNSFCDDHSSYNWDDGYKKGYQKGLDDFAKCSRRKDTRLWQPNVNLNNLLCESPELRLPKDKRWEFNLPHSEHCPYCGAFSYWHRVDRDGNRKCCRCEAEWKPKQNGNYWIFKELPKLD